MLKLFLVFCGYVDVWGQQFTSFMIFVIVVMCGATTNKFFFYIMSLYEAFCFYVVVLIWGKTNKDIH